MVPARVRGPTMQLPRTFAKLLREASRGCGLDGIEVYRLHIPDPVVSLRRLLRAQWNCLHSLVPTDGRQSCWRRAEPNRTSTSREA
jgi:hypothetical protein